jgi:hypothetical protein
MRGSMASWLTAARAIMPRATARMGAAARRRLWPEASTATISRWRTSCVQVKPMAPTSTIPSIML